MSGDDFYRMTPTEIGWGYLLGYVDASGESARAGDRTSPRTALEDVVREALQRPPCGVAFSGGRDSSLVLAVATDVARREGLPAPVPITRRFPNAPETDETDWQDLVIRRLGLGEWVRIDLTDELDVVGPIATRHLRRHGVIWPPSIASDVPMVEMVSGGTLLDGEGGDEVLGVAEHRIAPVTRLVREPRHIDRRRVRRAVGAVAPARLRVPRARRRRAADMTTTWLLPDARHAFMDALDAQEAARPLSFAASVRRVPRRRTQTLLARNRNLLAESHRVVVRSPLLDPRFVDALARDGGVVGRGTRAEVIHSVAADLLPDELIARHTKSSFTSAYLGAATREFAERWDGTGLDPQMVDPEVLRALWRSDRPPAPTAALLQSAWLASQRADVDE